MKRILLLLNSIMLVMHLFAQGSKDSCCLAKKEIVGVWQRDSKEVGNGLEQNIRFFDNGSFEMRLANEGEDARGIYALKGKYRLVKNSLYITVLSRTVVEGGKISISPSNERLNIFSVVGGNLKQIEETDPKEIPDPIYITIMGQGHIQLDNEIYYKIPWKDLEKIGIHSGPAN